MLLTVLLPDQTQVQLPIADNELVFDGSDFLSPQKVEYVILVTLPVEALSLPFDDIASATLLTEVSILARVLQRVDTTEPDTDPRVIAVSDPSDGTCVCFVTCAGTELRFIQVHEAAP